MGCKAKKIFKNFAIAASAPQRSMAPGQTQKPPAAPRIKNHRQGIAGGFGGLARS
jgi:hypothetical protein